MLGLRHIRRHDEAALGSVERPWTTNEVQLLRSKLTLVQHYQEKQENEKGKGPAFSPHSICSEVFLRPIKKPSEEGGLNLHNLSLGTQNTV
jgi:hypothetical protein